MNLFATGKDHNDVIDITYGVASGLFVDSKKSEATKKLVEVASKTHEPRAMVELMKHSYAYKESEDVRKLASEIADEVVIDPNGVYLKALIKYNTERENFIQKHNFEIVDAIKCKNIFKEDKSGRLYSQFESMVRDCEDVENGFWIAYQGFKGQARIAKELGEELDENILSAKAYLINENFRFEKDDNFNIQEFENMAKLSGSPKAIYYANKCKFANCQFEDLKVPFNDVYEKYGDCISVDEMAE